MAHVETISSEQLLGELLPRVVDRIVGDFHPVRVILFGSLARGEAGPDSDIDLMVVFDHIDQARRHELVAAVMAVVRAPVPVDVFVTDVAEFETKKDVNGSMVYWPSREGVVVHERSVA